ncbi:MAG TPA: phospholipase D-like domain-containing protein [Polyangiaceae bacterium]|nr:phospholipase D-like domain-containing protein [Polyangiaceae bacterium]
MALGSGSTPEKRIPWRLRKVDERFIGGNRIRLLRDGRETYPAMLAAIAAAREQVLLEMYWFDSDRIGQRFAAALCAAAERGVEVAVIYDAIGSLAASPAMFEAMAASGVHVIEFNPVAPWKQRFRLAPLTRRDHRKILLIDGTIGFTGGLNIADQWLPEEEEGGGWRDDMVCVEGPAVRGFMRCFQQAWRSEGGPPLGPPRGFNSLPPGRSDVGGGRVRVLGEAHFRNHHAISRAYLSHLYRARSRAWLVNSYFIPDRRVLRALVRAARRGVDVRIIVPGESDVPVVNWASRAVWTRLLRRGVRLYQWTRGILHAKTAVIDGRWSTIGTFNLDHLSLRSNLEVNVTVLDDGFGQAMEAAFERDLLECREVDAVAFRYRSLGDRLLELIAYRFRKFM